MHSAIPTHPLLQNDVLSDAAGFRTPDPYSWYEEVSEAVVATPPANDDSYENVYPSFS